jgi:transposase
VVRRKRLEKWRTNSLFLVHDHAAAHRLVLVKDFFAKTSVTTLKHPPYSPGLAPTDFYLFPRLKSALKGRCFCDATDIIKNVAKELKRLSKNAFQECFQQFYSH